jgi:hypothetical protein
MGLIATLLKYVLKYLVPCLIIIAIMLNVVTIVAFPVRMNPEMPQFLRIIAIGTPLDSRESRSLCLHEETGSP